MTALDDDRLDPSAWRICAVALFGALLSQLDATIVNVSLSNLATDLGVGLSTIQWVTSGYLLALTLALPLNGWLVDRVGAKRLYLWCLASFTLSSVFCGLAWSAPSLIGFRALQGLSGGLLAPMAQMMVAQAAGRHMARVAGYAMLPVLLAPVLGPVIAGSILQHASWRWLFLVNLPIGALAIMLAFLILPESHTASARRKLDWAGLALLSPGLALFLYGMERTNQTTGCASLAAGVLMMAAFIRSARRKGDDALIDLRLFRGKVFATATTTQFLSNGAMFAGQMLIPAFLIQACGRTSGEMGWMLAPLGLGMMATVPLVGALVDRFGVRRVSSGGALLTLAATLPLLYLSSRGLSLFVLLPALFVRGMGMGAIGLPSVTAAYASVRKQDLPMATTSANIVQRLGGPTMTTLCASFLSWKLGQGGTDHALSSAFTGAFVLLCGFQALTFLAALRLPLRVGDVVDVTRSDGEKNRATHT
ncbi:membrane transporter [Acetobacter nitrogenifigens DSM 23921 = NBRC 105050]|uniref:MFS transporter n=1 Tax=Acetobacter nitrogenifigens DSM 23921 = NBRC 105050 TaxID=1120919 RepID=A0A511XCY7_9PROT|nr:DHA2 family efflux MFS transporter permease subunit [Acetobacter nitrogenifigens]GBQ87744.1 membrane transporter [Acetobacter nitrogenifigens DSM 23921 = NBRC 105050]GEN60741.1 MFS transporter [Acetobacter nitrogenifigens DSM 23921 = NBRC 105050]